MDKIVFFHMNQLGDLMFSLPLLAAARKTLTGARLVSVVRPELAPLLAGSGLTDEVLPRPRAGVRGTLQLARRLRKEQFSKAVFFSESPEVLLLGALAGIPERYGFNTAGLRFLLTAAAERTGVPSAVNNRRLADKLGLPVPDDYAGLLRLPQADLDKAAAWITDQGINPGRLVVIAAGASKRRKTKYWEPTKWAGLIDLLQKHHLCPVLAGAPAEEEEMVAIAVRVRPAPKVFTSSAGILSFAALLAKTPLFIGIDSGAMHLAAALGTPVTALFGPTDPLQIGPQPLNAHGVVKRAAMQDITVEDVWAEICSFKSEMFR
jgi:ADP-heptose:LPS heptosyltransferase